MATTEDINGNIISLFNKPKISTIIYKSDAENNCMFIQVIYREKIFFSFTSKLKNLKGLKCNNFKIGKIRKTLKSEIKFRRK